MHGACDDELGASSLAKITVRCKVQSIGIDRFADTTPWGIIGGVLLGFAVSVWMAWRTAQRLMAEAKQYGEPQSVPFDDEDQGV